MLSAASEAVPNELCCLRAILLRTAQALGIPLLLRGRNALLAAETGLLTMAGRDGHSRSNVYAIRMCALAVCNMNRLGQDTGLSAAPHPATAGRGGEGPSAAKNCAAAGCCACAEPRTLRASGGMGARRDEWRCLAALAHRFGPAF